jgi:hypothetical protein
MTFEIPVDYAGITLGQFVKWRKATDDIERIMAAAGLSRKQAEALEVRSADFILRTFSKALDAEHSVDTRILRIGSKWIGFVPDIERLTFAEHIDASAMSSASFNDDGDIDNLITVMCVLWRPVQTRERVGGYYRIEPYDSEKIPAYRHLIEQLPMTAVSGTLLFFSIISNELQNASLSYLEAQMIEALKEVRTEMRPPTILSRLTTDGTMSSKHSRIATLRSTIKSYLSTPQKSSPI